MTHSFKITLGLACITIACSTSPDMTTYLSHINLADNRELPFFIEQKGESLCIVNGDEQLPLTWSHVSDDNMQVYELKAFQGQFHLLFSDDHAQFSGFWLRPDRDESYPITGSLTEHKKRRFSPTGMANESDSTLWPLAERYATTMATSTEAPKQAIAEFQSHGNGMVTGSIMTETGDYRFLAGNRHGNHLMLSTFDGIHAYIFDMVITDKGIQGLHQSGAVYAETFEGHADADASLSDPTQLSSYHEGDAPLQFTLPDHATGESFTYDGHANRVTLIQILGSWCPNCMDESEALKEIYQEYHERGLDVIALAFERSEDPLIARPALIKMVHDIGMPYPVLYAGKADKGAVEQLLPGLSNFMSYPTAILLDRQGLVREVHTGFNGPGTSLYQAWLAEQKSHIEELLNE